MTDLLQIEEPEKHSGGARVSSGKDSKQDYGTPQSLVDALGKLFKLPVEVDLAATPNNTKAPSFITPAENSLSVPWFKRFGKRLCFLNPPFSDIEPWARKCRHEALRGSRICFLTPASVDSIWWEVYVHNGARILFCQPRITFIGAKDPYPKPCAISCYNLDLPLWYQPWKWK